MIQDNVCTYNCFRILLSDKNRLEVDAEVFLKILFFQNHLNLWLPT